MCHTIYAVDVVHLFCLAIIWLNSMVTMDYGYIFKRSFEIAWRYKFLWVFGILGGGAGGCNGNFPGSYSTDGPGFDKGAESFFQQIDIATVLLVLAVVLAILVPALIFLGVISRGALIGSIAGIETGKEAGLRQGWRIGLQFFWRVLGLGLLIFALVLVALIVLAVPGVLLFLTAESSPITLILTIPLMFIAIIAFIVFAVALGIVGEIAHRELIIRNGRIVDSLKTAYGLFRKNLGPSLIVWLITIGIGIGAGVLAVAALLLAAIPGFAIGIAAGTVPGLLVGVIIGFPLLVLVIGFAGTVSTSVWTLGYLQIDKLNQSKLDLASTKSNAENESA